METIGRYLEGQLQSAQFGTGSDGAAWFIPDPDVSMPCAVMESNLGKLNAYIADISQYLGSGHALEAHNAQAMINIFSNKTALYQQVINSKCIAIDHTGLPIDNPPGGTPNQTAPSTSSAWDFIKKNPIPIAIIAFFSINALLPKNKKIIKF